MPLHDNMIKRRKTIKVRVGSLFIGGDAPITIQSMTNTDTRDIQKTINQIHKLTDAGCEIVRCAVVDMEAAKALSQIKKSISIPLVADIHFDYRLALKSIESDVAGLRINPGNIGSKERVKEIVKKAKERGIKIRIGVNSGSLEKWLLSRVNRGKLSLSEAMVESALEYIKILESIEFNQIVISLKSSDVLTTIDAYRLMAQKCNYPFHIGITEAGTIRSGTVKSSVGIGILIYEGICDTLRVSLASDPVNEVLVARDILRSLGMREDVINVIACPTCGRAEFDVEKIALAVEKKTLNIKKKLTVAIMGCIVNGPGEAKEADIGIAGSKKYVALFRNGEIIDKLPKNKIIQRLLKEIENF